MTKASRSTLRVCAAILLAAIAGGCSALAPVRDESRYYVLNPVAAADRERKEAPMPELIVGVGPVAIPQYLDRSEIVARAGAYQISPVPNARWGEPLQPNLARVLAEDLAVELGTGQVIVFPWFSAVQPACTVAVDVQRFEMQETGAVVLNARWTLRHRRSPAVVVVRDATISEPADRRDAGAAAAAMSRAVARLSEEIAVAIRGAHHAANAPGPATPRPKKGSRKSAH